MQIKQKLFVALINVMISKFASLKEIILEINKFHTKTNRICKLLRGLFPFLLF